MSRERVQWFIGEAVANRKALRVGIIGNREYVGKPMFIDFDLHYGHALWLQTGKSLPLKLITSVSLL